MPVAYHIPMLHPVGYMDRLDYVSMVATECGYAELVERLYAVASHALIGTSLGTDGILLLSCVALRPDGMVMLQ